MKNIVITGSTRGIGYGLADAFLARGCGVVVSGRSQAGVEQAVAQLARRHDPARILGQPCDVTVYEQVQALWDTAARHFGQVDIWINNAGLAQILTSFWDLAPSQMQEVVDTNVLGTMYGSKVALLGMKKQGFGSLYNMEGYGSRGRRMTTGLTLYGSTKAAIAFLNDSLVDELKGGPIIMGMLRPGMVATDMLYNQRTGDTADWERSKRVFNILADRVETVAPWLADRILSNQQHGAQISWLTPGKVLWRFLSAPFIKRQVME